jgi:hypothetical protein
MESILVPAAIFGALVAVFVGFYVGARRFAVRQQRLGRWDEYGPLEETQAPPHTVKGGEMSERLEVIGKWKGEVLRRREPHEPPGC